MIYFDNAATTKPAEEIVTTFERVLKECYGNPNSPHTYGHQAQDILERARAQIARYLGADPEEIIFTSGATESNNLALKGAARRYRKLGRRIITTRIEHASVLEPVKDLEADGFEIAYLDVGKDGSVDFGQFERLLTPETVLVSVMAVNNETGHILPVAELLKRTKARTKALFHTDATQALFKIPLDLSGFDLVSMSAHKLNGFKGSGVLLKRKSVDLEPQIVGGGQESGYRSGTANPPLAAALAATFRTAAATMPDRIAAAKRLRFYLRSKLAPMTEEVVVTSPEDGSPFILSLALKRHKASVVVEALAKAGFMVSTKSACSARHAGGSYVLKALGYSGEESENALRLSFSGAETVEDGRRFVEVFEQILKDLVKR